MGTATLRLEPLDDACFGAVVHDVAVRDLDDDTWAALHAAWIEHALLIFPGQFLTQDEQNDFARRFGELEFAAAPISNVRKDGTVLSDPDHDAVKSMRGNEGWHHDSTYMPVQAKGAVFSAEIVPTEGAATGWADTRAAYEALDPALRARLQDLRAYHSLEYSQGRSGNLPTQNERGGYDMYGYHGGEPSLRPIVKVHPVTGRPNLCIGRHAHAIVGMDPAESERLLDELNDFVVADDARVHFHQWTVGDTVVWDNRRLLHCATPYDLRQPRRMWHTRIAGERPSELALNYA